MGITSLLGERSLRRGLEGCIRRVGRDNGLVSNKLQRALLQKDGQAPGSYFLGRGELFCALQIHNF